MLPLYGWYGMVWYVLCNEQCNINSAIPCDENAKASYQSCQSRCVWCATIVRTYVCVCVDMKFHLGAYLLPFYLPKANNHLCCSVSLALFFYLSLCLSMCVCMWIKQIEFSGIILKLTLGISITSIQIRVHRQQFLPIYIFFPLLLLRLVL